MLPKFNFKKFLSKNMENVNINNWTISYCKKTQKIKKIFITPWLKLDGLWNDTSFNALRWIYRSAKIDWTKKAFDYVVPPPQVGWNKQIKS